MRRETFATYAEPGSAGGPPAPPARGATHAFRGRAGDSRRPPHLRYQHVSVGRMSLRTVQLSAFDAQRPSATAHVGASLLVTRERAPIAGSTASHVVGSTMRAVATVVALAIATPLATTPADLSGTVYCESTGIAATTRPMARRRVAHRRPACGFENRQPATVAPPISGSQLSATPISAFSFGGMPLRSVPLSAFDAQRLSSATHYSLPVTRYFRPIQLSTRSAPAPQHRCTEIWREYLWNAG